MHKKKIGIIIHINIMTLSRIWDIILLTSKRSTKRYQKSFEDQIIDMYFNIYDESNCLSNRFVCIISNNFYFCPQTNFKFRIYNIYVNMLNNTCKMSKKMFVFLKCIK